MKCNKVRRCGLAILLFSGIAAVILNIANLRILNFSTMKNRLQNVQKSNLNSSMQLPIILWWADLTHEPGMVKQCGSNSCFVTNNRSYIQNSSTKVVMFYGSNMELDDLPLPRRPQQYWAIIHEESPKNNWAFSNEDLMQQFDFTATFRHDSDFPLTLTWLTSIQDIESKSYYHTFEEKELFIKELSLSPIAYVQSDCDAPSDRDHLVDILSQHISVDSLGKCLNNKQLPKHISNNLEGMDHADFYELLSKYKFVIAAENAICEDYITEKFWRSFYVGTIPIVYGSPTITKWLPSPGSAVVIQDFDSIESLVDAIGYLNSNSTAYNRAVRYKLTGVSNKHLIEKLALRNWGLKHDEVGFPEAFQCYVCKRISQNDGSVDKMSSNRGLQCPKPTEFMKDVNVPRREEFWWPSYYAQEYNKGAKLAVKIAQT